MIVLQVTGTKGGKPFCAAVEVIGGLVFDAAPILRRYINKPAERLSEDCERYGWAAGERRAYGDSDP